MFLIHITLPSVFSFLGTAGVLELSGRRSLQKSCRNPGAQSSGIRLASTVEDSVMNGTAIKELDTKNMPFNFSPPMSIQKFERMQQRRVHITIKYSDTPDYELYCVATHRIVKELFPDVIITRVSLPYYGPKNDNHVTPGVFEVLVDQEVVYTKRRNNIAVYLQIKTIAEAVRRSRRKRRPGAVVYGDTKTFSPPQEELKHSFSQHHLLSDTNLAVLGEKSSISGETKIP